MTLERYLKLIGMTPLDFSKKLGTNHATVYRWIRGRESIPTRALMRRVYSLTGGLVDANDFYGLRSETILPLGPTVASNDQDQATTGKRRRGVSR